MTPPPPPPGEGQGVGKDKGGGGTITPHVPCRGQLAQAFMAEQHNLALETVTSNCHGHQVLWNRSPSDLPPHLKQLEMLALWG